MAETVETITDKLGTDEEKTQDTERLLQELAVLLRDESNRPRVFKSLVDKIGDLYNRSEQQTRLACLRVLANAVADCNPNRELILENGELLEGLFNSISQCQSAYETNFVLTVLYNWSNEFEPALARLTSEEKLPGDVTTAISEFYQDPQFALHVAAGVLERFIKNPDVVPQSTIQCLLTVSTWLLEQDPSTEDIEVPTLLMRLIESSQQFEQLFIDKSAFDKLLNVALLTFHSPEICQHSLSALGNISSLPNFPLEIDADEDTFKKVQTMVHSDNPIVVACAACILGNMAVTSAKVELLLSVIPDLVPVVMNLLQSTQNPFEMQAAHLIKNLSTVDSVKGQVEGVEPVVAKMMDVKIFPQIRLSAVQLAQKHLNRQTVSVLCGKFAEEDDTDVKFQILRTMPMAIEKFTNSGELDHLAQPFAAITPTVHDLAKNPIDQWNAMLVVKITKAIGMVANSNTTKLADEFPLQELLESSQMLEDTQDSMLQAVQKNLAYIGAAIIKSDANFNESLIQAANQAIRNCNA